MNPSGGGGDGALLLPPIVEEQSSRMRVAGTSHDFIYGL